MILKSVVFNISNCNRNMAILIEMRGSPTFSDLLFTRYVSLWGSYKLKMCKITRFRNTPGQSVDFAFQNPKCFFSVFYYVPLSKKVVTFLIPWLSYSSIHPILNDFLPPRRGGGGLNWYIRANVLFEWPLMIMFFTRVYARIWKSWNQKSHNFFW